MDNFTGDFFGLIGKPMLWKTVNYGTLAVHIKGISPNGRVAVLTIDLMQAGGIAPREMYPELDDGIGFAILGDLSKRPTAAAARKPRKAANPVQALATAAGLLPAAPVRKVRSRKAQPSAEVTF